MYSVDVIFIVDSSLFTRFSSGARNVLKVIEHFMVDNWDLWYSRVLVLWIVVLMFCQWFQIIVLERMIIYRNMLYLRLLVTVCIQDYMICMGHLSVVLWLYQVVFTCMCIHIFDLYDLIYVEALFKLYIAYN